MNVSHERRKLAKAAISVAESIERRRRSHLSELLRLLAEGLLDADAAIERIRKSHDPALEAFMQQQTETPNAR